jgi:hypothetical protein
MRGAVNIQIIINKILFGKRQYLPCQMLFSFFGQFLLSIRQESVNMHFTFEKMMENLKRSESHE